MFWLSPKVPVEFAQVITELFEEYTVYQRQPSGRYAVERYPSLISLLSDASNSSGAAGGSGEKAHAPLSLDVVDVKARYSISDPARFRSRCLGMLAVGSYSMRDLEQWRELHGEIRGIFYPPVKEFTSTALTCSRCGERGLHGVNEPEFAVWCPACHMSWGLDDYEAEVVSQLAKPLP